MCHEGTYKNRKTITTNGCESTFCSPKANIVGNCHHVPVRHLHCYLNEQSGKWNSRNLETSEQMGYLANSMKNKRIRCEKLTAHIPEQEAACNERQYEEFGISRACLEAADLTGMDRDFRGK